jgi:hypothetical protein
MTQDVDRDLPTVWVAGSIKQQRTAYHGGCGGAFYETYELRRVQGIFGARLRWVMLRCVCNRCGKELEDCLADSLVT